MEAGVIRRAAPGDTEVLSELSVRTFSAAFGHLYPPADLAAFLEENYAAPRTRRHLADSRTAAWLLEGEGAAARYALAGPCGLPPPGGPPPSGRLKRHYLC